MMADNTAQKILFVTGKGGVGKSTVALAQARRLARQGFRTLLVELGNRSYLGPLLGIPDVGYHARVLQPNLHLVRWTSEECLREYVLQYLKLDKLYRLFFENKVMKAFINIAPGLREVSILGKVTSGIRQIGPPLEYDRIVVDCFATGHAMALFRSPVGLGNVVNRGPMNDQCSSILRVLRSPELCEFWVVSLLEELPVSETLELARDLNQELGASIHVVANKVLNPPVSMAELNALDTSGVFSDLTDFVLYLRKTMERQDAYRARLRTVSPLVELTLVLKDNPDAIVNSMEAELGN